MKKSPINRLSTEDVMEMLDVRLISGKRWQLERLCRWIERLVATHGKAYVRKNRRNLLAQWEEYAKAKFKTCI